MAVDFLEQCHREASELGRVGLELGPFFALWGPRKISTARQAPRNCSRMIPVCSPSDSMLFTPKTPATPSHSNFSRSPIGEFDARIEAALAPFRDTVVRLKD